MIVVAKPANQGIVNISRLPAANAKQKVEKGGGGGGETAGSSYRTHTNYNCPTKR